MNISDVIKAANLQYSQMENNNPREGYIVQFYGTGDQLTFNLEGRGGSRDRNALLSGIPQVIGSCPFCSEELAKNPLRLNITNIIPPTQRDTVDAVNAIASVISNRGQVLFVPEQHFPHWFNVPIEIQTTLLQAAIALREKHPESRNIPIELHCGSAGRQSVFHTHVRTNVYMEKKQDEPESSKVKAEAA